ncbi:alanine/ornithine racemase family PLP-dependent enzyme [archaeon]|jgi:ornithine racemase|nr:alanine/ornithine racemase family PLP-dependent enzyme [archaeon]MBT4397238.1 alanine/ornithine racemase family PLP-dependent enzyme [archaeon]MBT4440618.1 alanine/ornithine racemase family PLP-dependent enzyme [archaeon]
MSRIEIDLDQIRENYARLKTIADKKGISIYPVTKVAAGDLRVARTLEAVVVGTMADSRIENIRSLKLAGIRSDFLLLRAPAFSEIAEVVKYANYSLNSSMATISKLDLEAKKQGKQHGVVLMLEMGDLREGTSIENALTIARRIKELGNVYLYGIGANFACYGGVAPTAEKMQALSNYAKNFPEIQIVSGGNSANISWLLGTDDTYSINNLRIGEAIMLGLETLNREPIKGLNREAFVLAAEVIEVEKKESSPYGEIAQDAFGNVPEFEDEGIITRAILSIGRQDVDPDGLTPFNGQHTILGASSDHLIIKAEEGIRVGDEVYFTPSYSALLRLMTSPFVQKKYVTSR